MKRRPLKKVEKQKGVELPQTIKNIDTEILTQCGRGWEDEGLQAFLKMIDEECERGLKTAYLSQNLEEHLKVQSKIVTLKYVLKMAEDAKKYFREEL